MFKKQNGITLIALVITIIVLLILAGVSISLVVGENGVLNKASTAKEETIISQESETVKLAAAAAKVDTLGGEILEENLARELTNTIGTRDVDYSLEDSGENFLVTYLDTNRGYLVSKDGTVTQRGKWYTEFDVNTYTNIVTDGINVYQIGDIVYYDHITGATNKTYTSAKEKTGYSEDQVFDITDSVCYPTDVESGLWRILGVSEKGELLIVSDNVVKVNNDNGLNNGNAYYLNEQAGYANAISELNNISAIFGQGYGATGARSITMNDVNKLTGYNPSAEKYGEGKVYEYGTEVTIYWDGDSKPYYKSVNDSGSLSFEHTDGFNWYDNGWKVSPVESMTATTDINQMKKIATIKNDYYYYDALDYGVDDKIIDLIFNNSYYTASVYKEVTQHYVAFNVFEVRGGCSTGYDVGGTYGGAIERSTGSSSESVTCIRPVVTLNEDIKLTGSSETGWTIVK